MSTGKLAIGVLCALGFGVMSLGCDAGSSSDEQGEAETDVGPGDTGNPATSGGTADDTSADGSGSDSAESESETAGEIEIDPANMIDDLEDGDPLILAADGRRGAWYTYNDETEGAEQLPPTPFEPTAGGPGSSLFMAQTSGTGFTLWGAGVGVDLNNEGDPDGGDGMRMMYDASAHQGIVFHARGNTAIRVKLLVDAVVPLDTGGSCAADCEDAHGKIVPLSEEWQQFTVGFDEAFQEGWGTAATFDPATLISVQFQVSAGSDFEFALDQIGFY